MIDLNEKLAPLATTPAAKKQLAGVVERIVSTRQERDGTIVCSFGKDAPAWRIAPPRRSVPKDLPADLRAILARTAGMTFDELELHDGRGGLVHDLGEDVGFEKKRDGFTYAPSLVAPIVIGHGHPIVWLYGPRGLVRWDGDGGRDRDAKAADVGAAFLQELARLVVGRVDAKKRWFPDTACAIGGTLAVSERDNGVDRIRLFDVADGRSLGAVELADEIRVEGGYRIALSEANGKVLAWRARHHALVDVARARVERTFDAPGCESGVLDGDTLVTARRGKLSAGRKAFGQVGDHVFAMTLVGDRLVVVDETDVTVFDRASRKRLFAVAFPGRGTGTIWPLGGDRIAVLRHDRAAVVDLAKRTRKPLPLPKGVQPRAAVASGADVLVAFEDARGGASLARGKTVRKIASDWRPIWIGASLVLLADGRFVAAR